MVYDEEIDEEIDEENEEGGKVKLEIDLSNVECEVAKVIAEKIADKVAVDVNDKIIIRIGNASVEIDPSNLLNEVKSRIETMLRNMLKRRIDEALKDAFGGE